jgi:hypothetical protein
LSVYDDIKKALQDLLAPDIKEIKGDLKAVNARLDAMEKIDEMRFAAIDRRFDAVMRELAIDKRIERLERQRGEEQTN